MAGGWRQGGKEAQGRVLDARTKAERGISQGIGGWTPRRGKGLGDDEADDDDDVV